MIVNRYKLNTIPDRVLPLVMVSQFDTARQIEFELYDGTEEYAPTSAQILIGTNQYEGTISSNIVSFTVPSELTQESQYLFGEIVCFNSGRMGTCNFRFKVDFTPLESENNETLTINQALSIVLGRNVNGVNSQDTLNILLKGE